MMFNHGKVLVVASAAFLTSLSVQAQQLEIIHTNDLHSSYEHSYDDQKGSYAAVKATIDRLKAQSAAAGIDTLTLDAGDFTEGSPFFMVGDGTESMRLVQEMGYDAIAIGNHDWLVGADQMNQIFSTVGPHVPFLSANLNADVRFTALHQYIHPSAQFEKAGIKIGVLGLSTNDILYRWAIKDGKIEDPQDTAKKEIKNLRKENDLVIALTHLGVTADQSLAANVDGIDLIVGGHSHTALTVPVFENSPNGKSVPIVQAGSHGEYVGDLLIDYEPGQPLKIFHYQLIPVYVTDPQDPSIASEVVTARQDLENIYGQQWLSEVLTTSDVPMEEPISHPTVWGNIWADALRETAQADIGLDISEFFGGTQAAGPITREKLMNFYPRTFDLSRKMGWNVWRLDVPGWLLKIVLEVATKEGTFFNLSNVTFDVITGHGAPEVKNTRIGGKPLNILKTYHCGVSEGLGLGSEGISKFLKLIFWQKDTGVPVWTAVENKIRAMSPVLSLKDVVPHRLPASVNWRPARADKLMSP
jgi:5'-nucleotidase/UDP-sugar diphosphatase